MDASEAGKTIGHRILIAAAVRGLNNVSMARALGISQQGVGAVTTGRTVPSSKRLLRFAEVLNVSVEFLIGGDDVTGQIEDVLQNTPPRMTARQLYIKHRKVKP